MSSAPADGIDLGAMTSPELKATAPTILIVPLGATEQHGPHLSLDTDTVIAEHWARAAAAEVPGCVVAPALPYGSSGEHDGFAGTLSIGQDALVQIVVELARSARHRFDRVVFVSGHGGNAEPLRRAVETLRREGHRVDGVVPRLPGADAHAGHTETSLLLHLAPARVRTDRLEPGHAGPLVDAMERLRTDGVIAVSANGVLGDPMDASPAHGAELWEVLVASLAASLRDGRDC